MSLHFKIRDEAFNDSTAVVIYQRSPTGTTYIARPIVFEESAAGFIAQPTLSIDGREGRGTLKELMDQLWIMGIRPNPELAGATPAALDATKFHLEDMRTFSNKLLTKLLRDNE